MNLPQDFLVQLQQLLSEKEIENFIQSVQDEKPTSIRINPHKKTAGQDLKNIPWSETGYYLPGRKKFTFDPLFHAGAYYVQEAGSMLIEQALKQHADLNEPLHVLDLCASPGGKSTHLLSLISNESILVSNEIIGSRIPALEQNIIKWGTANCIITQNDPEVFSNFSQSFDIIVIDAPCSGEGMFRKHDHAVDEWSESNVKLCAARQERILENAWPALKENGLLLYSTCTYNLKENEENIAAFLNEQNGESLTLELPEAWKIKSTQHSGINGYRMMPHLTNSEGFFLTVIRKKEEHSTKKIKTLLKSKDLTDWKKYILQPENFTGLEFRNHQYLFPKNGLEFLTACMNELRVNYFGIELGEIKGKDFIPSQALAQSNHLNQSALEICEVSEENALRFLQKDAIVSTNPNHGIQLVTFQNLPLGFIKNIGNRSNNLFPKNWRILNKQV
ncbi:MAG: rRNA methyltransferase [Crocinitomicaceae bacterium]|nr:rRNA methyltransferase [Crocinitomicaceae bacterium]